MDTSTALMVRTTSDDAAFGLVGPFGVEAIPRLDGPVAECPVCRGIVDQLALTLDLAGFEPACCDDCGALLAA